MGIVIRYEDVPNFFRQAMTEGTYGRALRELHYEGKSDGTYQVVTTHAWQTFQANRENWNTASQFTHNYMETAIRTALAFSHVSPSSYRAPDSTELIIIWEKWGEIARNLMTGADVDL